MQRDMNAVLFRLDVLVAEAVAGLGGRRGQYLIVFVRDERSRPPRGRRSVLSGFALLLVFAIRLAAL